MLFSRASQLVSQAARSSALATLLVGCSVYDPALAPARGLAESGRDGNSAAQGNPLISASAFLGDASLDPGPDDPWGAREEDGGNGPESDARCGDGQVTGIEKCDIAIPVAEPGACPQECPALGACVPRIRNGTGCQTECVLRELTCESGDGCCPGNCTKDNDLDCSARCGDGIVQESGGETCEPATDRPCLTASDACDDADACTIDRMTGSAANCNTACVHERIQSPDPNDVCCPPGANANTDPDCDPRCGNAIVEAGEDCDGSDDCDPNCQFIDAAERTQCLQNARDDCERCACMKCTATELACRLGPNAQDNTLCDDILVCSARAKCLGTPCYCGDSPGCTLPNGPCKPQVEAAAGLLSLQVAQQVGDINTPLGRSYAADQCRVQQCEQACR